MTFKFYTVIAAVIAAAILSPVALFAQEFRRAGPSLDDAFAASCRVNVAGARGSGTFIGAENGRAYILTNYHVVGSQKSATVDFWTDGNRTTLPARVDWRYYDASMPADFAILSVDAAALKSAIDPPFIAVGGRDARPSVNDVIVSAGAPKGRNVSAWRGKVTNAQGETAIFQPAPVPGQSGSCILTEHAGELFQVGVLTWLIGQEGSDEATGGAIPIANLYAAMGRNPIKTGSTVDSIPAGAVECSAPPPVRLFEFTRDNCPACVTIAPVVAEVERAGYRVEKIDTTTAKGMALAKRYGVTEVPSFILTDNSGEELGQVSFLDAHESGAAALIGAYKNALARLNARENALGGILEDAARDDFRTRPRVAEDPTALGLFDDAEKRWKNRGNDRDGGDIEEDSHAPLIGGGTSENDDHRWLVDRFAASVAARISGEISSKVDSLAADVVDSVAAKVGPTIEGAARGIGADLLDAASVKIDSIVNKLTRFALAISAAVIAALAIRKKGSKK